METKLVIKREKNKKYSCNGNQRSKVNNFNSIKELINSEFKSHLDNFSKEKREKALQFLISMIVRDIKMRGLSVLIYPGDLLSGAMETQENSKPLFMYRDIRI